MEPARRRLAPATARRRRGGLAVGDETSVILARCRVLDVDFEMCKALRVRETRLFQKLDMPVNRKPARFIIEGGTVWLDEISIDQDAAGRERLKFAVRPARPQRGRSNRAMCRQSD